MADIPQPAQTADPENEPAPDEEEIQEAEAPINLENPDDEIQEAADNISRRLPMFRSLTPIGLASNDGIHVYTAKYRGDVTVVIKLLEIARHQQGYQRLQDEFAKSNSVSDYRNILKPTESFTYGGYYCVVIPFMAEGSIRSIMAKEDPNGLDESQICAWLRPLSRIHNANGRPLHKEINAGRVFIDSAKSVYDTPDPKLAFGASVYDLLIDNAAASSSMPSATICNWAAAPEVVNSNYRDYTAKADVWLVGIMALELAYGGLQVNSRDELLAIVKKITKKKKLPKTLKKDEQEDPGMKKMMKKVKEKFIGMFKKKKKKEEDSFSKLFGDFVALCLAIDPEKRADVDRLDGHHFLTSDRSFWL